MFLYLPIFKWYYDLILKNVIITTGFVMQATESTFFFSGCLFVYPEAEVDPAKKTISVMPYLVSV